MVRTAYHRRVFNGSLNHRDDVYSISKSISSAQCFVALHLLPYYIRLILPTGVLMHCKALWWQALKAFNKRNVKETSSVHKICLNDSLTCLLLSPAS